MGGRWAADGRQMGGRWAADGRQMTVDDGEWTVDGRRMCADGFAIGGDPSAPVAVGFVGRCRFCRGDAGLPRPCARGLPDKRMEKARLE